LLGFEFLDHFGQGLFYLFFNKIIKRYLRMLPKEIKFILIVQKNTFSEEVVYFTILNNQLIRCYTETVC
jgi:hypothetical protein